MSPAPVIKVKVLVIQRQCSLTSAINAALLPGNAVIITQNEPADVIARCVRLNIRIFPLPNGALKRADNFSMRAPVVTEP